METNQEGIPTGINKAYAESELTKNSGRKPISIPVVPANASLPQTDLSEELNTVNKQLIANLEEQIKTLQESLRLANKCIEVQDKQITALTEQVNALLFGGGCGGSCGTGRD